MKNIISAMILSVLSIVLVSCNSVVANPTETSVPTAANLPTATSLPVPTITPEPTLTSLAEDPGSFEYTSVAEALADLKTKAGVKIEVSQGWTIITEADGLTTWSFAPSNNPAYPAVAKRVIYKDQGAWSIKMNVLCEANKASCDKFVRDFEALNEQMRQALQQGVKP